MKTAEWHIAPVFLDIIYDIIKKIDIIKISLLKCEMTSSNISYRCVPHGTRIGIYVGSFDPFHIGHLEVIQIALNYVDKIIIVPNNPNKDKIFRSNLYQRLHIIELSIEPLLGTLKVLGNDSRITVTDESIDTLDLYDNYHLIGLIGVDQCHKEPKTKVHEWLIVPRTNYQLPVITWSRKPTGRGLAPLGQFP